MRRLTSIHAFVAMLICLCVPSARSSMASSAPKGTGNMIDSDEFFRATLKTRPRAPDYSQKIEALLRRMTLEEKVGQMTQLTLEMVVTGHDQTVQIDHAKLQKAINRYGVGSILNCYNQALTPDKWQEIITEIQKASRSTRLGIPVIYGIDSIHGANYVQGAT